MAYNWQISLNHAQLMNTHSSALYARIASLLENPLFQFFFFWLFLSLQFVNAVPTANEENYFTLAKQFYQPDWMPQVWQFTEFPGTRLLYQYISGFFLSFMSFEAFAFTARLISIPLLLWPLLKIFRLLGLNFISQLLVLLIYIFLGQSFFAGGWIFGGFEAKTFAYVFVLASLYQLLVGKVNYAFAFAALGTLFHVLVGGWFTVAMGVFLVVSRYPFKKMLLKGLIWLVITSPLLIYLIIGIWDSGLSQEEKQLADFTYTHIRAPHHTAIFYSWPTFLKIHAPKVLFFLVTVGGLFFVRLNAKGWDKVRLLYLSFGVMIIINLIVGYFDNVGSFTKYYPYRMTTIALLLFSMIFTFSVGKYSPRVKYTFWIKLLGVLILLPNSIKVASANFNATVSGDDDVYSYCKEISEKDEVFLFTLKDDLGDPDITFMRRTGRSRYFVYKFMPGEPKQILDWAERYEQALKMRENPSQLAKLAKDVDIDYVVSKEALVSQDLTFLKEINGRFIYRVVI